MTRKIRATLHLTPAELKRLNKRVIETVDMDDEPPQAFQNVNQFLAWAKHNSWDLASAADFLSRTVALRPFKGTYNEHEELAVLGMYCSKPSLLKGWDT